MVNGERVPSQAAIGRELGLSPAAMTKLKKQGMPVHLGAAACRAWRQQRQNIAQRKPDPGEAPMAPAMLRADQPANDESHDQARTRREIAEANLAELKLMELRGDLVRAAAVRAAAAKRYAGLRDSLLQLPARVVPLLIANPDASAMDKILRSEIVAALDALTSRAE